MQEHPAAAENNGGEDAMLRFMNAKNLHSQFPSALGLARSRKKRAAVVPHLHPETFFRTGPVLASSGQVEHVARSRDRRRASKPIVSQQRAYSTNEGVNMSPSLGLTDEPHHAPTSANPNALSQENSQIQVPIMNTPIPPVQGPISNFVSHPPPPEIDHRHKRGPDPRRLVLMRPIPNPDYFNTIIQGYHRLETPRPLLVILDMNGVLVHRRKGSKVGYIPRTGLDSFLKYLFSNHHVMVWSSGMPENINKICRRVFTAEQYKALISVWARDTLRLPADLFKQNIQVYKQLSWVWESDDLQAKAARPTLLCDGFVGRYDQRNTVLVDDSIEKAIAEPFNLLPVSEFTGQDEDTGDGEGVLGQVVDYLEELKWFSNVSAYMAQHPFKPTRMVAT